MVRWNQSLNLTKIVEVQEAVERHYVESLFLAARLPLGNLRIADIGSGPGFPGFPTAILRPDCEVTLIESHQRTAVFLREASRGIMNIRISPKRAEDIEDRFDWLISRAVSYDDLAKPFSRLGLNAALLTGEERPPSTWRWTWEGAVEIPGGRSRFLRVGQNVVA